jgi:hypothetical protein
MGGFMPACLLTSGRGEQGAAQRSFFLGVSVCRFQNSDGSTQNATMKTSPSVPSVWLAAFIAVSSLLWSGCANLCQLRDARTGQLVPENFTGTVGLLEHRKTLPRPVVLRSVETVSCTNFDRVVFTFEGAATPGYKASYIDKPIRQCASGNVIPVAGDAWLEVQMIPAQAHNDAGQSTVADRNRQLDYPNLRQLVETCDFEGHETWVLGVGSPNRFRVTELSDPPRLVVDVKHAR